MRRVLVSIAAIALLATTTIAGSTASTLPASGPLYMDAHAPVAARVADLLRQMTLTEKAGQMDQILIENLRGNCQGGNGDLVPSCMATVFSQYNTGSILAGGTDNPVNDTAEQWALDYNAIQQYAMANTRLHIPVLFGVDAVHGFGHPVDAPLFPQSIGIGATWDPAMAQAGGQATGQALAATGWLWDFAPVQDLARDPRWGRYYETWSEAPYLTGTLGAAFVTGLQNPGGSPTLGTAATVKHFAGYSQSINGHDRVEAQLPIRYLQDTILPGYAAAVKAGARTVMVDSGSINGVPATSSHYLLTDVLRNQLHFKGVVISDYGDVRALQTSYHLTSDYPGAIALAVNAGVDMAMEPSDPAGFVNGIVQDVQDHKIPMWRIDQAVTRILTLKFQLGLFDHPLVDPSLANATLESGRAAALQASEESITLLRNQGSVLPLSTGVGKIVVTGPAADSIPDQLGGWSVSWQGVFGGGQVCCASLPGQVPAAAVTTLKGIENEIGTSKVDYQPTQSGAVAAAAGADAIVAVVGEGPYAEGLGDKPDPILDTSQQNLIAALEATGKPVIVVVVAGRPLGLGPGYSANAIVMAYQGGTETGTAVADVLFGKTNPSGHLPFSWPSASTTWTSGFNSRGASTPGDEPKTYDQLPGTNSGQGSGYNPAYPIGVGLSYTTFGVSGLSVSQPDHNGNVTVTFTVANTGSRDGTDVVPIWVAEPPLGAITVPPKQLVGSTRIDLAAGQSKTVSVTVSTSWLKITSGDINGAGLRLLPSGTFRVTIGSFTANSPSATFTH
jgi:beta-glucosidase